MLMLMSDMRAKSSSANWKMTRLPYQIAREDHSARVAQQVMFWTIGWSKSSLYWQSGCYVP